MSLLFLESNIMIIKNLEVENFRNIQSAKFIFSDDMNILNNNTGNINIISGNNAQGKTNLMEALTVSMEKSFRTVKAAEMLPRGVKGAKTFINADFTVDKYPEKINRLACNISEKGIFRKINDVNYKDAIKLYPQLKSIVFIPEDLYIIKGSPEGRREIIDETADMINKIHHSMVNRYQKALKQKNALLSRFEGVRITADHKYQFNSWNEELAKAGVNVLVGRLKYFDTFSKYICEYYSELNNLGEKLSAKYFNSVMKDHEYSVNDPNNMLDIYYNELNNTIEKELIVGHTLIGVHRDDICFFIDGKPVKEYASQGQIRSIAVAVRLAQAKLFREKWGESPIIVLDDVLSELDGYRREFILQHIMGSQVFITGCNTNDFSNIDKPCRWVAENGSFRKL